MVSPLMNQALKYLKAGKSIIPLIPRSKEPKIPWMEFQQRRATYAELETWFTQWPEANLGIITGTISNLSVVDVDGPEGFYSLQRLGLTSTVTVLTGNGRQLWYTIPHGVIIANSVKKIAPGIDIRGEGGYVVVPPSVHPNGKRYRFLGTPNFTALPEFPRTLLSVIAEPVSTVSKHEEGWIGKALEEMKIGNIDDTLVSLLGRLRRDGFTDSDALSLLQPHAIRAGATPGHLEDKIKHVWESYEPNMLRGGQPSLYDLGNRGQLSIHSPNNPDSIKQYVEHTNRLDALDSGTSLKTGFTHLDQMLEGGLKSERLFTVAARTGTGKTNFAIALARNLCESGKKVLLFSTEFGYKKIWDRYIATLGSDIQFRSHAFYVCDSFAPNLEQVEKAINDIKPDVFIFDHINHLGDEREILGQFMLGCNFLQRKYNCQGVMVAQLNRQADWVENGERVQPRMSMVKGSGTIEQASSRVLLLSETRITPEYNEIVGVLDKNDSGDKGIIQFGLYKNPYHFREIS